MSKYFSLLFIVLFTYTAKAQLVPYETIQTFHDKKAKNLTLNYGLEDQVDISINLAPRNKESLNAPVSNQKIQIPGILLGGIDAIGADNVIGAYELISDFKNYSREVKIIKKRPVSDEEIRALQAGIRDQLFLRDDESISIQDNTFNWAKASQFWSQDLQKTIYESIFSTKYWSYAIPIVFSFLLLGLLVFSALRFNSSLESMRQAEQMAYGEGAAGAAGASGALGSELDDDSEVVEEIVDDFDHSDWDDLTVLLDRIFFIKVKSQYELYNVMWESFSTPSKQMALYEAVMAEDYRSEEFKTLFFDIFPLKDISSIKVKDASGLSSTDVAKLRKNLLLLELSERNEMRERALSAIYPRYGGKLTRLVESSIEKFFSVIYYLFPEIVIEIINSKPEFSAKISEQLAAQLSRPDGEDELDSTEVNDFISFLETGIQFIDKAYVELDENTLKIMKTLPDRSVLDSANWGDQYKDYFLKNIPNTRWIRTDNIMTLKSFFMNLTADEVAYIAKEHNDFNFLLDSLDDRGRIRVSEKLSSFTGSTDRVQVVKLRDKIKKSFSQYNQEEFLGEVKKLPYAA